MVRTITAIAQSAHLDHSVEKDNYFRIIVCCPSFITRCFVAFPLHVAFTSSAWVIWRQNPLISIITNTYSWVCFISISPHIDRSKIFVHDFVKFAFSSSRATFHNRKSKCVFLQSKHELDNSFRFVYILFYLRNVDSVCLLNMLQFWDLLSCLENFLWHCFKSVIICGWYQVRLSFWGCCFLISTKP